MNYKITYSDEYLAHHGILGQKWGIRRYQREDGSLTAEGRQRYTSGFAIRSGEGKSLNPFLGRKIGAAQHTRIERGAMLSGARRTKGGQAGRALGRHIVNAMIVGTVGGMLAGGLYGAGVYADNDVLKTGGQAVSKALGYFGTASIAINAIRAVQDIRDINEYNRYRDYEDARNSRQSRR